MNILFITSNRLGDAVLSTGLLDHLIRTYPAARITIACGGLPASLFEGMPNLEKIIILKKQTYSRHWLKLWMNVVATRWDMIIDLRDSAVSRVLPAKRKYIHTSRINKSLHKVEQNAAVMNLATPPAPVIWVSNRQQTQAKNLVPDGGPVLAIGPTANWIGKTWPAERFVSVIEKLTGAGGILPGARIAVFAAPGEEEAARIVLGSVPQDRQIDMIARIDPGTAAAALQRCAFYIGNDSGLMHCAAAAGIPTLGLFGPSWPHLYRPWGKKTAYVATPQDFAQLTAFEGYDPKTLKRSLMEGVTLEAVLEAANNLFMSS
jgi:lipopolysaccharide export system permease protein